MRLSSVSLHPSAPRPRACVTVTRSPGEIRLGAGSGGFTYGGLHLSFRTNLQQLLVPERRSALTLLWCFQL